MSFLCLRPISSQHLASTKVAQPQTSGPKSLTLDAWTGAWFGEVTEAVRCWWSYPVIQRCFCYTLLSQDTKRMKFRIFSWRVWFWQCLWAVASALAMPFPPRSDAFSTVSHPWVYTSKAQSHSQILRLLEDSPNVNLMNNFLKSVSPTGRRARGE